VNLTHGVGRHASPQPLGRHDVVLCVEPGIRITEQWVHVRGAWHPVAELTDLGVARGPTGPGPMMCLIGGAALATAGEAAWVLAPIGNGVAMGSVAAVLAGGFGIAAFAGYLHRPYQLWVRCGGAWMLIFASRDEIQFGKVQRAMQRAMRGRGYDSA